MSIREQLRQHWPFFGLELRTPRLLLTPVAEEHLPDLLEAALAGIHAPDVMPFDFPWSTQPPDELVSNSLKHYWSLRFATVPDLWNLQFAVLLDGKAVGVQDLRAKQFATVRTIETGSWLRMSCHGQGIGTEMRAALLEFGFDHLGAQRAISAAFADNPASNRVSAKLGYQPNGRTWLRRRPGEVAESLQLLVTPETFRRPDWTVQVSGLAECRPLLGI